MSSFSSVDSTPGPARAPSRRSLRLVDAEFERGERRRLPAATAHEPRLDIRVLGGFSVRRPGHPTCVWERPMAVRVLRFLLVHKEHAVHEDLLFEAFWPHRDPRAARRSLTVALSLARRGLSEAERPTSRIVTAERCHQLALAPCDRIDSDAFEAMASNALHTGATTELEHAAALWTGEPLPEERYAAWTTTWRDRLSDTRRDVLARLTGAYAAAGRHLDAVRVGQDRLDHDPLDEAAHRDVMAAYARAGRRDRALEQFLTCRRTLVETLGIEPAQATRDLQARVLRGDHLAEVSR